MFGKKNSRSKGLATQAAFILMSAVVVIFLFSKTGEAMEGFIGEQDTGPETEIEILYDDVKSVCQEPETQSGGTVDISSESSLSESLEVCQNNPEFLCYGESQYGDGNLGSACSEGIQVNCNGDDSITGQKSYTVTAEGGIATINCEEE